MPIYTCTVAESTFSADTKRALAGEIARIHSSMIHVPSTYVNVAFHELAADGLYTDGVPASPVLVSGWVREGHPAEDTTRLATEIATAVTRISGIDGREFLSSSKAAQRVSPWKVAVFCLSQVTNRAGSPEVNESRQATREQTPNHTERMKAMPSNFGDFQIGVYLDAVKGVNSRYPFDFQSIERKASEALPDWVYRYVSAAAGDGRTQRANIAAYSRYGITPRMMVSPPERDLSITLFDKHFDSPIFMCPIGLIGLCAPDFQGDVAAAQASAATGVPFTLSTFSQAPMEDVIKHAGTTPSFYQLYLPGDRELAASLINRAETSGYSALVLTVDSWALGYRPSDLQLGNFPQFRGFCMENYCVSWI